MIVRLTEEDLHRIINECVERELVEEGWKNYAVAGAFGAASMFGGPKLNAQNYSNYGNSKKDVVLSDEFHENFENQVKKDGNQVSHGICYVTMRNAKRNPEYFNILGFLDENKGAIGMFPNFSDEDLAFLNSETSVEKTLLNAMDDQRNDWMEQAVYKFGGPDKCMGFVVGDSFVIMPKDMTLKRLISMYDKDVFSLDDFDI